MVCYQTGCAERPTWQLNLTYRPRGSGAGAGAGAVALDTSTCACWDHRAQLLRSYCGARGAAKVGSLLRVRGLDPGMADQTVASLAPIFARAEPQETTPTPPGPYVTHDEGNRRP